MRQYILGLMVAMAMAIGTGAGSLARADDAVQITQTIRIEILFSEDMANRATGRAAKVPAHLRAGASFARITDFLGEDDLKRLAKNLRADVTDAMTAQNITVDQNSNNVIWITIVDAVPNEWTINQVKRMRVSLAGAGIGSAALVGQYYDAGAPNDVHTIPYKFYSGEADTFAKGWRDANKAIETFSEIAAITVAGVMAD